MMRKKIFCLVLTIILSISIFQNVGFSFGEKEVKAQTVDVELTVHYHRYAQDYTIWNMWLWSDGNPGQAYDFDRTDDYGVCLTASITEVDSTKKGIGLIVRTDTWAKDTANDRFIPYEKIVDGKVEIWLLQGDANIYYNRDDVDISPKVLSAVFQSQNEIFVTVTAPITQENQNDFEVYEELEKVDIDSISARIGKNTITIKLLNAVNYSKTYTVKSVYYKDKAISMEEIFSSQEFSSVFSYSGELGAIYSKDNTTFKIWAPTASSINLNLYSSGDGNTLIQSLAMSKGEKGLWSKTVTGNLHKTYYTYTVTVNALVNEVTDPYAKAAGVNGNRGMVIDLAATNPQGWENQERPINQNVTDAIIYEAHIRDLTIDTSSGVSENHRGKFLGLTEKGTVNSHGDFTALSHLIEMGITELHILPMFDYATVDETRLDQPQFNWGYDPQNYNVPEGSYSTDPYNGEVRINELKTMIMTLHNNGIRVVMDVVYNHTSQSADSNFNKIMPGYYYRMKDGEFSNGSGCGNETASERDMYRKFMIDSVVYWASEYKIDGFRFDLMGLHDIETMNLIRQQLDEVDQNIIIYGEGWTAGDSTLRESKRSIQKNAAQLDRISVFNDIIRDGIKGSVFSSTATGFVSGSSGMEENIKFGAVGGVNHSEVNYPSDWWTSSPTQSINYSSAHDNNTLYDKLKISVPDATQEELVSMNNLAAAIVLTSQGVPFFHAGEEMLRSKPDGKGGYDENSYSSPDSTNSIKWDTKTDNKSTVEYYKGLIALRKAFGQFRMASPTDVLFNLQFLTSANNVIAYRITKEAADKSKQVVYVIYNANSDDTIVNLDTGTYDVYAEGNQASSITLRSVSGGEVSIQARSAMVLVRNIQANLPQKHQFKAWQIALIAIGSFMGLCLISGAIVLIVKKDKIFTKK